jgi:hypothetical protein
LLKHRFAAAALAVSLVATPVLAVPASAEEAAKHYSVAETPAGKLIDDPAAAEVLKKHIPTVWANEMFQTMGRDLPLKAIQQYEPDALSDDNLAKIQADLDKIPARG